jgi:hypothetical protein
MSRGALDAPDEAFGGAAWELNSPHRTEQHAARRIERALLEAEKTLALVDSLSPVNFEAEVERLTSALKCGQVDAPAFRYESSKSRLTRAAEAEELILAVRRALDTPPADIDRELSELLWQRAHELLLEVELLRSCDSPSVTELSAARFALSDFEIARAEALCHAWLNLRGEADEGPMQSLSAQLSALLKKSEAAERIVIVERDIAAIAAIGDQILYVRKGSRATARQARRIWAHEVEGHLLPRLRAQVEAPPFAVGTPGCSVDEEGRAIVIEERGGVLDGARKRELAIRFLLARAVSTGGVTAGQEALRELRAHPIEFSEVVRSFCRVLRGGGLCRELIYLAGYLRVKDAFDRNPESEQYFRRGRASICALPFFARVFG